MTEPVERGEQGRFVAGQSPKSPGRPKGRQSAAEQVRQLLEPHKLEIIAKAVELAKLGDPVALRLVIERLSPAMRPEAELTPVAGLAEADTPKTKAEAILIAVAKGEVSAEAGERLLRMLDVYTRAIAATEIEERLQALERGHPAPRAERVEDTTEDLV